MAIIRSMPKELIVLEFMRRAGNIKGVWIDIHDQFEKGDWITVLDESFNQIGSSSWFGMCVDVMELDRTRHVKSKKRQVEDTCQNSLNSPNCTNSPNSVNCPNCSNCPNSVNCPNCSNCPNCRNSKNCLNCPNSTNCPNCKNCPNCSYCLKRFE